VQVGVVRDSRDGRIIGMGSRAISRRYVNGKPVAVGYLSGLRLLREYRGKAGLLARGYQFLRSLHADRRAPYYLTTIAADNEAARVLTSARAGLPIYHPWGNFHTLAISTSRSVQNGAQERHTADIRNAQAADRDAILDFLKTHGPARQFFPVYDPQDLFSGGGMLQGINPADILLAVRDGQIVGALGCWNQRGFKQIVIHGYRGYLSTLRPLYNAWAGLRRQPTLPPAGSELSCNLSAIPVVRDDCRDVFPALLAATCRRLAELGERLFLVGLHEEDLLLRMARKFAGREYLTTLYIVYWPEKAPDIDQLKQRVPYLELGSL
jgi:hypothetical protein